MYVTVSDPPESPRAAFRVPVSTGMFVPHVTAQLCAIASNPAANVFSCLDEAQTRETSCTLHHHAKLMLTFVSRNLEADPGAHACWPPTAPTAAAFLRGPYITAAPLHLHPRSLCYANS